MHIGNTLGDVVVDLTMAQYAKIPKIITHLSIALGFTSGEIFRGWATFGANRGPALAQCPKRAKPVP